MKTKTANKEKEETPMIDLNKFISKERVVQIIDNNKDDIYSVLAILAVETAGPEGVSLTELQKRGYKAQHVAAWSTIFRMASAKGKITFKDAQVATKKV